ncbi:prephenate dehydrogenase [Sporobacter termitidis DSM 10068]|uniref:Prephenate dehydrogenase n=1 Tax=Sporobacter termitidis DSM 10068 TaxID=1123282 RepID=A0A1M5X2Q3_9FIRM|nr:prephenate dehydrogenase [Sporobacter termitidis]SHH93872.1 prephenate dehydrogenase [Sporobacter termitidis DSM 10068]
MIVGIAGLGLIGGSLAKAYKSAGDHTVYGFDADEATLGFAQVAGAIDGVLTPETAAQCGLLLIALYPKDAVEYLRSLAPYIPRDALVIDCCGVKRFVCQACFELAAAHGFTFVGGHPMAGTHNSGFKYSRPTLFKGAAMILVPPVYDDIMLFDRIEKALAPAGFGHLTVTTGEKHDEMIAFTSQMAHVVSNAFIKSPAAREHKGYSAGSYKDLTRVAWLNPDMWSELFLENRDVLIRELDFFIGSLSKYRDALDKSDGPALRALLDEGRRLKEELDGR